MRRFLTILLLIVLGLVPSGGITPASASAALYQPDDCILWSDDVLPITIPSDFPWVTYNLYPAAGNFSSGYTPLAFNRADTEGVVRLDLPEVFRSDLENWRLRPIEVSPDGRLLVLVPREEGVPFYLWDMLTDEVVTIELLPDFMARWIATSPPDYAYLGWWQSPTEINLNLLSNGGLTTGRQPVRIGYDPLRYELGTYEELSEAAWEANAYPGVSISPDGQLVALQTLTGPRLGIGVSIFPIDGSDRVYAFMSNRDRMLTSEVAWSPDSNYLVFRINPDRRVSVNGEVVLVDVRNGFVEVQGFSDQLLDTVTIDQVYFFQGGPISWSRDGTKFATEVVSITTERPYIMIYDLVSGTSQIFCSRSFTYPQSSLFWTPDDRYFGIHDGFSTYIFDLETETITRHPESLYFTGMVPPLSESSIQTQLQYILRTPYKSVRIGSRRGMRHDP